jgi:DNA-binding NarL/FixJ family response regulator
MDDGSGQAAPRVLLADGHAAARVGIRCAIEPHGLCVIGEASCDTEAVALAIEWRPEICVIAVGLPDSGVEAARVIKQSLPATKIVMLTVAPRDDEMLGALRAGADGYLPMSTSAKRLAHTLRGVYRGEAALPRDMTARLIAEFRERGSKRRVTLLDAHAEVELTAREFEVLERLRKRERTAEIAAQLGISEVTVRRHVSSVLQKLGSPNRNSAIQMLEQSELQPL